jgi:Flp pilus assembly protein TadD/peroxiredoxin
VSRAPDRADPESAPDYLDAFERVFRLHEQGMSFSGRERNCAFLNTGRGDFADISAASGLDFPDDGRGLAITDWDHDGDLDLWFANRTAPRLRFMRNDLDGNRFLRLHLEGRASNRDAIGARAELTVVSDDGGTVPLVRTLRAGEGFLSQSSKWLHFGLGQGTDIERLVVRWPNGGSEEFTDLQAGRHYRLVEGTNRVELWEPPRRRLALRAGSVETPESTTPERVVFAARAPLPALSYHSFDGQEHRLATIADSPRLLNIWASWCLPCVKELGDLAERELDVRATGLDVLALSVDGLDEAKLTTTADAERFIAKLDFPFTAGMADPALLDKMQLLHDRLFSIHLKLAVPTSFLIDRQGRLAAVYRGVIDLDRLLEDVRNLSAAPSQRRLLATPLVGRWLAPPQELSAISIAKRFAEEGLPGDAAHLMRFEVERQPDNPDLRTDLARFLAATAQTGEALAEYRRAAALAPDRPDIEARIADLLVADDQIPEAVEHYRRAIQLGAVSPSLHHNLGVLYDQLGSADEATTAYMNALELDDGFAPAHARLGRRALAMGDLEAAADHFDTVLKRRPDDPEVLSDLAVTRLQQDRLADAQQILRRALEIRPDFAGAHNNMGIVLVRQGNLAAALEHFQQAVTIDPTLADARTNLEVVRGALGR